MTEKIEVILVDIGSTSIKSAEVINEEVGNRRTWPSIDELLGNYHSIPYAITSVRNNHNDLHTMFDGDQDLILDHRSKLPIEIDYDTPETLGADRIALAAGANYLFPNSDNLVIDMGTCVTMDLVDSKGVFRGGTISPGLIMRMKAMANYTKSLPDISDDWDKIEERKLGRTTRESLRIGAFNGLQFEINGAIAALKEDFATFNIILTGGDAKYFDSHIKAHIFAGSKIVEIGLYRIWKYQ